MDLNQLIQELSLAEKKVLLALKDNKPKSIQDLAKETEESESSVTRSMMWLAQKQLADIQERSLHLLELTDTGKEAIQNGLPEDRFLKFLKDKDFVSQDEVSIALDLSKQEFNISIGLLRRQSFIEVKKDQTLNFKITDLGLNHLSEGSIQMDILNKASENVDLLSLSKDEEKVYKDLNKRGLIKEDKKVLRSVIISEKGLEATKLKIELKEEISLLTSQMLIDGSWKNKSFRKYNLTDEAETPIIGKKQPYFQILDKVRQQLLQLGFKEMEDPGLIELEYYNFDVLYQPQNHPARTWTDTYHLKEPEHGEIENKDSISKIKSAHETGGKTLSIGWKYQWQESVAKRLMPRAHGTALSARTMASGIKPPCRYFAIARCFRPDVMDATHLLEFNQLEGFVADESINFRTLLGMLKQFAVEVAGATDVRFYPDYYPFTEPSVQMSAKHPELGWIEFGGAGIFRPEITESLGIDVPVMAWGLGVDRLAMFEMGVNDLRELFSYSLENLRKMKVE